MAKIINPGKYYTLKSTVIGAAAGYLILHPFMHLVMEFFHTHQDGNIHLHWGTILHTYFYSFSPQLWPHITTYIIFSALTGYFFGKTISAYRKINKHVENLSIIGMNASGIIHDFNNPLTVIIGTVQGLKHRISDPEEIKNIETMEKEAFRVMRMVQNIKRIVHGELALDLNKVSIAVDEFLINVLSKMTLKNKLKMDLKCKINILIDIDYFERVIWNLVKNADESVRPVNKGEIVVRTEELRDYTAISVIDNGGGIAGKNLKNLFSFGETHEKENGSGIGLYNCKKIIEAHGGKIDVESHVDKGTTFTIKISK